MLEEWVAAGGLGLIGLGIGWILRGLVASRPQTTPEVVEPEPVAAPQLPPPRVAPSVATGASSPELADLRKQLTDARAALSHSNTQLAERQRDVERRISEATKLDEELARRDRELESVRNQLKKRDEEHASLMSQLSEQRARMTEAGADLYRLNQELIRKEQDLETSLGTVAERAHEMEMLTQLTSGYAAEMDELTQQVQLYDGEIARVKAVLEARRQELENAQALLKQREAEAERIIRMRELAEEDVAQAAEQLHLVRGERERLLDELREIAEDADQRARLLAALENEGRPDAGPMGHDMGYGPPHAALEGHIQTPPAGGDARALETAPDNLTSIRGIGEGYADLLRAAGVNTFEQLGRLTAEEIREIITAPSWRMPDVEAWIAEARAMADEDDSDDNDFAGEGVEV